MIEHHIPILCNEVVENMVLDPEGIYIDCTLGFGGHSEKILNKLDKKGMLLGIEIDPYAYKKSKMRLKNKYKNFNLFNCSYIDFPNILEKVGLKKVDGFLFDLGISSHQVNNAHRGFSFMNTGPLDMRFNPSDKNTKTAHEILNSISEKDLSLGIKNFGEERHHKRISRSIINARENQQLNTTLDLKNAICKNISSKESIKTLSRVFQAIRIISNNELDTLKKTLIQTCDYLNKNGRIAVISFHSVEDRIIKHFFKDSVIYKDSTYDIDYKLNKKVLKTINKKPIIPEKKEVELNPRSRSAKLRIAEKV